MKWYRVKLESFRGKSRSCYMGDAHGTSMDDALARVLISARQGQWLDENVTKFNVELEYDEKRTKAFDENDWWGPYL